MVMAARVDDRMNGLSSSKRTTDRRLWQIPYELAPRPHSRHQQPIARPGARHIEEMPLGLVDIFQVCFVSDRFDPRL